jgi:uncharacterized protein YpuA (DUF1002 family)
MRKTVRVLVLVIVALVVACAYLSYAVLDQSVTLDHARVERASVQRQRDLLSKLTLDVAKGTSRGEVEALIAAKYAKGYIVKRDGDIIFVDEVGLRFRGDELVEILFMN